MLAFTLLTISVLSAVAVSIVDPVDGGTYNADWLPLRAIVENENVLPDSVHYTLNGGSTVQLIRLSTDWPTYMQNNQNHGYSQSPAPMTSEVLWTAPVSSCLHEFPNPIVANGVVYYPANMGDDKLHALDAATGQELWAVLVGPSDDPPTYDDGYLYQASDLIFCIDALSGAIQWTFSDADGDGSTPCVFQDRILVGTWESWPDRTSHIYCLNKNDGEVIWDRELSGLVVSCAGVDQGVFFVPTWKGPLYAIDAYTGDTVWENGNSESGYWDSSPVIVSDSIFIGSQDGDVFCFNRESGDEVWSVFLDSTGVTSTLAVYEDMIIVGTQGRLGETDGMVTALNRADGSTVWSIPNSTHGSFAVADNMVFWGSCANPDQPAFFAADAATGGIVWEYEIAAGPYGLTSTPSITDGVVYYAGTDGLLYAFGTGLKWTYQGDLFTQMGANELIVTSFENGIPVAADTINFTVAGTGIDITIGGGLNLAAGPNPFMSVTSVSFELNDSGYTSVLIYDLTGREVAMLYEGELPLGNHSLNWNGIDDKGQPLSSGLYLCRLQSGGTHETVGVVLLR